MARRLSSPSEVCTMEIVQEKDRTVCRISGELDSLNASRLRAALGERTETDVVVDLSGMDFIDSSGLGVLVGALKRFQATGHRLSLRAPTTSIRRVLAITGLDQAFTVED